MALFSFFIFFSFISFFVTESYAACYWVTYYAYNSCYMAYSCVPYPTCGDIPTGTDYCAAGNYIPSGNYFCRGSEPCTSGYCAACGDCNGAGSCVSKTCTTGYGCGGYCNGGGSCTATLANGQSCSDCGLNSECTSGNCGNGGSSVCCDAGYRCCTSDANCLAGYGCVNYDCYQKPTFTSITPITPNYPNTVSFSTAASPNSPATTVRLYVCKSNDGTSSGCGAGGTWCSASATASNPSCSISTVLGVGTYNYYAYIFDNNNLGATNNPKSGTFSVNKGTLAGSISGNSVVYPTPVNIVPTETNIGDSDVNYTFWRNTTVGSGTLVSSAKPGNPSADTSTLTAGTYSWILNSTGGSNWTSNASIAIGTWLVTGGATTFVNVSLNATQVWWQDPVNASGYTSGGAAVSVYLGNSQQCSANSIGNGFWNCTFAAPTGIGIYTISANTSTNSTSTNLNVFPFYGLKGIGNAPRVVYVVPFLIQDLNGTIQKVFVRVAISK